MIGNSPLIHGTGDWWQCDQSESNSVKTKEGALWWTVETVCGQNKLRQNDLRCRCCRPPMRHLVSTKWPNWALNQQQPQCLLNTRSGAIKVTLGRGHILPEDCYSQWAHTQMWWFNWMLVACLEVFRRTAHKWLLIGIRSNSAVSCALFARMLKAIPTPTWQRTPDMRGVKRNR